MDPPPIINLGFVSEREDYPFSGLLSVFFGGAGNGRSGVGFRGAPSGALVSVLFLVVKL